MSHGIGKFNINVFGIILLDTSWEDVSEGWLRVGGKRGEGRGEGDGGDRKLGTNVETGRLPSGSPARAPPRSICRPHFINQLIFAPYVCVY